MPPAPARFVTDQAGVLSAPARDRLDERLARYQQETGHQVIVWIGELPSGQEGDDFAARAFSAWGVGRKGKDDGVAVFFFPQARRMRIEVGYGLEGQLTDIASARIIRDQVTPRLRQADWDGAVTAAVDGVLGTIGGEAGAPPAPAAGDRAPARPLGIGEKIVLGLVGLLVLGFLITHPSLAVYLLFSIFSGGGRGGGGWSGGGSWGGGGGGFSGGGGRAGGGGASGSW